MKRFFGRVAKFVITSIRGKPIKEGTEMTVQFEKVGEGVTGHKKIKKHHRRNKQPAWFKEFVDNVFLPTIARIEATLAEHGRRLDKIEETLVEHGKRLDKIEATLVEHGKRLDKIEATLVEHGKRLDKIEATLVEHGRRLDKIEATLTEHKERLDRNKIF